MTSERPMSAVGRRVAVRLLVSAVLAGMWLIANQPLPVLEGRSHGCEMPDAAASQEIVVAPVQTGCHQTDVICFAVAGCVAVAPALLPTRMALSAPEVPRSRNGLGITLAADLFKAGPPTPPPNS